MPHYSFGGIRGSLSVIDHVLPRKIDARVFSQCIAQSALLAHTIKNYVGNSVKQANIFSNDEAERFPPIAGLDKIRQTPSFRDTVSVTKSWIYRIWTNPSTKGGLSATWLDYHWTPLRENYLKILGYAKITHAGMGLLPCALLSNRQSTLYRQKWGHCSLVGTGTVAKDEDVGNSDTSPSRFGKYRLLLYLFSAMFIRSQQLMTLPFQIHNRIRRIGKKLRCGSLSP